MEEIARRVHAEIVGRVADSIESFFVIFDNWDGAHPAVQRACAIAVEDPSWQLVEQSGISYVVRRKNE